MKNFLKGFWCKNKFFLVSLSFVILLVLLWQLVTVIFDIDYFVLPRFSNVLKEFFLLLKSTKFYRQLLNSLLRILTALTVSILFGVAFGVLSVNGYIRACLRPLIACMKSLPVMAITLILLVSIGKNYAPIFIGIIMAFPITYNNTFLGVDGIDKNLIEMAKVYKVSKKDKLFKICLPQVLPSVFIGVETASGMCVKAVISSEILCYTVNSLGLAMHIAKSRFNPKDISILFAYCLVAIFLALGLELLVKVISKGVLKWK